MRQDPADLSVTVCEALRSIAQSVAQPGDYVLIGRATVDGNGAFMSYYDWFYRPPGDGPLSLPRPG